MPVPKPCRGLEVEAPGGRLGLLLLVDVGRLEEVAEDGVLAWTHEHHEGVVLLEDLDLLRLSEG